MTYRGHVKNGMVVFDQPVTLPDGTQVNIEPETPPRRRTLAERLHRVIGAVEGMPADLAEQHDHYLHGGPKK